MILYKIAHNRGGEWSERSAISSQLQRMVFTAKYMFTSQYRNATWSGLLESIT
jgi:hypothetical protein